MYRRIALFIGVASLAAAVTASAQSYGGTRTQPSQPSTPAQTSPADQTAPASQSGERMQGMGQTQTLTGTVVSSGAGSLVVDTDSGRRTFIVDSESTVPSNLTAGSRVTVAFHDLGGGRFHAASVNSLGTEPIGSAPSSGAAYAPPSMGNTQTITGTVVSTSSDRLVLDTDSGRRTFMVDNRSSVPSDLAVGSRASVDFHTLSGGRFHAANVTSLGAPAASSYTGTMTSPERETTTAGRTRVARRLPATASDLPLVGLMGLIALGAALLLRRYRHRTA